MATADQTIAQHSFSTFHAANYPNLSADDAFERYAVSEIALRRMKLGASAVEDGIVGSTNDGGIDALLISLNGQELVEADSVRLSRRKNALSGLQSGVRIEVTIVQAKNQTKWDTNVFSKIESSLKAILDHNVTAATLRSFPLNDDVVEKALMLKTLREKLASHVPVMSFDVQYVTFAPEPNIDKYMKTKKSQLQNWLLAKLPSGSDVTVKYVGDSSIVSQLRVSQDFQAKLIFTKPPVRDGRAMVGLVKIKDYVKFLREERSNVLREQLFAVNVRDYAGGNIGVNNAIAETLRNDSPSNFWWVNNGITIIADEASDPVELNWIATNPMIVNGLQTSHVLHKEELAGNITKKRLQETVLVRLINESSPEIRESIIGGTNNQTAIAGIQLHANEEKQIRIEEYLRHQNWFYERRRYQYRGTSTPASRIRTVTDVAQAVMAYRLLEPDTARARPGTLLNKEWRRVFNEAESEDLYLKAVNVASEVEIYLKSDTAKKISDDITNARHYLISGFALRSSGAKTEADFATIPSPKLKANPSTPQLTELHQILYDEVNKLDDGKVARDQIFKGAKLKQAFFNRVLQLNASEPQRRP